MKTLKKLALMVLLSASACLLQAQPPGWNCSVAIIKHPYAGPECKVVATVCCSTDVATGEIFYSILGDLIVIGDCSYEQIVEVRYEYYAPYFAIEAYKFCERDTAGLIPHCSTGTFFTIHNVGTVLCATLSFGCRDLFPNSAQYVGYIVCDNTIPEECRRTLRYCKDNNGNLQIIAEPPYTGGLCGYTKPIKCHEFDIEHGLPCLKTCE